MNGGKWLAERILNGPFCKHETKEMALMRITPPDGLHGAVGGVDRHRLHRSSHDANNASPGGGGGNGAHKSAEFAKCGGGGALTLKQFVDKYSLPRIVKIVPEEPIAANDAADPATLLNGTLLLYKQYRSGKIEARKFHESRANLKSSSNGGDNGAKDVASTIVIPDTYQGWFSVMTERGQVKARQYTTVQRLIAAQVTAFLIIGPDVIGYYQNHHKTADGARSRYQYIKTVVRSGQILKLLAVYEDIAEQSTRSKRLSWPLLGSKQQSTQYAQCMTVKKQIVYIPITTRGYFYAVSTAHNTAEDNVSKVYQIAKLLQVFPLPVRVCSIYPQKINGSILLENYHKEDVMLACVLDDKEVAASNKFRFLEIDVNSKFYVNLVEDEHRLFKKARVQKALRNCHTDSEKWCQQLKVIHHIYPSKDTTAAAAAAAAANENQENAKPTKRVRKISLGDKKTVKSASFRYSTSYGGADETTTTSPPTKPPHPYRILPSATSADVTNATAAAAAAGNHPTQRLPSHTPPVYLNITHKPNEENCSSLPTQKCDRSAFENEILQSVLHRKKADERERKSKERRHLLQLQNQKKAHNVLVDCNYRKSSNNAVVADDENNLKTRVTKSTNISGGYVQTAAAAAGEKVAKFDDLKYRVIKKENTYVERDLSKVPRQPVYRTQVTVKIEDSYADAIDAIKSRQSSKDNIYAEIDEYQSSNSSYVIFPQKTSYFVGDSCSSSYIRVPSTSTVNVS